MIMNGGCCKFFRRCFSILQKRSLLLSQYDKLKSQFPNHILLFQVGDFYEIIGEDAEVVSLKTSLRIAKRNSHSLVGFPIKSLNEWQRTLVQAGFQLAICNQTDKKEDNGRLINREVVQVVTQGTLIEPLSNDANYLMAIAEGPGLVSLGLAWLDVSTSHFEVASSLDANEHIERVAPAEIVVSEDLYTSLSMRSPKNVLSDSILKECLVTPISRTWFEAPPTQYQHLETLQQFESGVYSLLEKKAIFALLNYISHTLRATLPLTQPPTVYGQSSHVSIDSNTRRALEITIPQYGNSRKATLLGCIDKTVTPSGGRMLKRMLSSPLVDVGSINSRLRVVEYFYNNPAEMEWVRDKLKKEAGDLERTLQKVITGTGSLLYLSSLQTTLQCVGDLINYLSNHTTSSDVVVGSSLFSGFTYDYSKLVTELDNALDRKDNGAYHIKEGYSNIVDGVNSKMTSNDNKADELTARLLKCTGLSKLVLVGHKTYHRVYETTKSKSLLLEASSNDNGLIRVDHTQSAVRYTHIELQNLNAERQSLESEYTDSVLGTFKHLCNTVTSEAPSIFRTADSLAMLDVLTSFSQLAIERGFCMPIVNDGRDFCVNNGFHPVVSYLQATDFVENDCHMDQNNLWIITGPNMGGKSTFLRQNALLVILAQIGCFVPAESAKIGVVDKVFARIGANDNVANKQSTFHMEMAETAHILNNATENSFVILDEIGRGTSPSEGVAIAQAVLEYIHNEVGCRTLLATHFHELSRLSNVLDHAGCYHVTANQDSNGLAFDYKVKTGHIDTSFGIGVAKLTGLPSSVIKRSLEIVSPQPDRVATAHRVRSKTPLNDNVYDKLKKFIFK